MWYHHSQLLCVAAVWLDNGLVITLLNYHKSIIIHSGVMRKRMGEDDLRGKIPIRYIGRRRRRISFQSAADVYCSTRVLN